MRRGQAKVLWAPVPEASVNEDSEAALRERKIWATWKVELPPPTSDPGLSKEACDEGLGGLVAFSKDAPHDPRAFGPGNGVDHMRAALLVPGFLAAFLHRRRCIDLAETLGCEPLKALSLGQKGSPQPR